MDLSIYLSIALVFFFIEHRFSYRPTSLKNRLYYLVRDLPFALVNLLLPPFLIKKVIFFYSDFLNKTIPNFDFLFPFDVALYFYFLQKQLVLLEVI